MNRRGPSECPTHKCTCTPARTKSYERLLLAVVTKSIVNQLACNLAQSTASMLRSMLLLGGSGSMANDPHSLHARLSALSRVHLPDYQDAKQQRNGDDKQADGDGDSRQGKDDTSGRSGGDLDMMWEGR